MTTEGGIPDILYKYRSWNDKNHKRLLTDRELYFASFDQFNDPFDGAVPFKYKPEQLTEENIFLKMLEVAKHDHPEWDDARLHEYCYEHQRRRHLSDEQYINDFQTEHQKDINVEFGIVTLAEQPDNYLLWSHYSSSHTGFCVGFYSGALKLLEGWLYPVSYDTELPLLDLFGDVTESVRKLLFTKGEHWKYEREYRLVKLGNYRTTVTLSSDAFACVVLGCKMGTKDKLEILDLLEKQLPHLTVYEVKLSKSTFDVKLSRIR